MLSDDQRQTLYRAVIGEKNTEYYFLRFLSFDYRGGGFYPSWNWAAFLVGLCWAAYRKMYGLCTVVAAVLLVSLVTELVARAPLSSLIDLAVWISMGIYGNALYYQYVRRKLKLAQSLPPDHPELISLLKSEGGVNLWAPWILLILFALTVFIVVLALTMLGIPTE